MRWSVGIEAEGDRVLTREEVVELADAVAASSGVATGIGTSRYGAQLLVTADSREDAIAVATGLFRTRRRRPAARRADRADRGGRAEEEEEAASRRDPARLARRATRSRARGCSAAGPRRRPRRCTPSCTSRNPTPSRRTTRSSTSATPTTCPRSGSRLGTRGPRAGSSGPAPSGRSTSAPTRCRAGPRAPRADRPRADRRLPAKLQRAAVRPRLEGRVDRRVLRRAHDGPRDPPRPGSTAQELKKATASSGTGVANP